MKNHLNNSAFISLDLLVAVILVLAVIMLALQIIPALNPPVPETNMKQILAATRASDILVGDKGWRASDSSWEESWKNNPSSAKRIGFAFDSPNTLDENKTSALMYPHNDTPASWWNNSWLYRERISITNKNNTLALYDNYSVSITLDTASLIAKGKMLPNGSDLRITYLNGTNETELDRINETDFNTPSTEIWFKIQRPIPPGKTDDNYSLYYGNSNAGSPPANKSKVYLLWESFNNTNNWTNWTNGEALPNVSVVNGIVNISNDPSNTFLAYRSNTGSNLNSSPKTRKWYKTSWGPEIEMPTSGSPIRWVRTAYSPLPARYYEKIVVTLSDDGLLDAYVWNGSAWNATNNIGEVRYPDSRGFDLAYEKTSGSGILVYGINSTNTSRDLAYKIWNGTQWSIEQYIDDPGYSNLEGWTKYKVITINGSTAGAQSNYQLKIDILYDSDMQSDFSDTRFTLINGTLLNHWRESYISNTNATFWVKVPNISAYPNTTILMQYGNATASNESNGDATFEFFDDFKGTSLNLSKWKWQSASTSVSNSVLTINATGAWGQVWSNSTYSLPLRFVSRVKRLNATECAFSGLELWVNSSNHDTMFVFMDPYNITYSQTGKNGSYNLTKIGNWTANTWYRFEIRANSSEVKYYRDGVLRHTEKNLSYIPTRPMDVEFEINSTGDSISADYVFVSKYVYPEPTYIIGDEQTKHYSWIGLAPSPISGDNDISMIARRYQNNIKAWIWDGSSWSIPVELETNASSAAKDIASAAYEQGSGDAVFVWAESGLMGSRKWNGTWGPELNLSIGKDINFISLKYGNSSGDLMATIVDDGRNLSTVYWNGTSWGQPILHDTNIDANNTRSTDFDWEPGGGRGLLVWGNGSGSLRYKTFESPANWSGASTIPAAGTHPWVRLRGNPVNGSIKILGVMLNSSNSLGALSWNGTALTNLGDAAFTLDTGATAYEAFDIGLIIAYSDLYADAGIYHTSFPLNSTEGFLIKQLSRSLDGEGHGFAYWLANISGTSITPAYFARDGSIAYLSRRNGISLENISVNYLSNQTPGTNYTYEVFRKGDGGMKVMRGGSQLNPSSGWVYDTNLTGSILAIGRWGNGSSEYDWLLVRKYLDPEPSSSLDLMDKWITGALPWWEYSSSDQTGDNASRALGLRGYNFYMQLRPLNESLFNEVRANYNITRNVPDARAAVVERYVFIRGSEALVNASGKTAGYRLILWVW